MNAEQSRTVAVKDLVRGLARVGTLASGNIEREFHEVHKLNGLTVGSRVHFTFQGSRGIQCRPAEVVAVFGTNGSTNLVVTVDGTNDIPAEPNDIPAEAQSTCLHVWRTSVRYSEQHEAGTWHWPKPALQPHFNPYEPDCGS